MFDNKILITLISIMLPSTAICSEKEKESHKDLPKETIAKQKKINKRNKKKEKIRFKKEQKKLIQEEADINSNEVNVENWAPELMQFKKLKAVLDQLRNAQATLINGSMAINGNRILANIFPIVKEAAEYLAEKRQVLCQKLGLEGDELDKKLEAIDFESEDKKAHDYDKVKLITPTNFVRYSTYYGPKNERFTSFKQIKDHFNL